MGAKHYDSRVYEIPKEKVIEIVKSQVYAGQLNLTLKSENPTDTGVWFRFHHGVTFKSWGEKITITITALPGNVTKVDILSECGMPTQVVDFGKNQKNVNTLFKTLEIHLNRNKQPTNAAPATVNIQPATDSLAENHCSICGAPLVADAAFCSKCGAKAQVPAENVCPNCGKVLASSDAFCSGCGAKIQVPAEKVCPNCNKVLAPDDAFCSGCGTKS